MDVPKELITDRQKQCAQMLAEETKDKEKDAEGAGRGTQFVYPQGPLSYEDVTIIMCNKELLFISIYFSYSGMRFYQ